MLMKLLGIKRQTNKVQTQGHLMYQHGQVEQTQSTCAGEKHSLLVSGLKVYVQYECSHFLLCLKVKQFI